MISLCKEYREDATDGDRRALCSGLTAAVIMRMKIWLKGPVAADFSLSGFCFYCFFVIHLVGVFISYCHLCRLKRSLKLLVTNLLNCGPPR